MVSTEGGESENPNRFMVYSCDRLARPAMHFHKMVGTLGILYIEFINSKEQSATDGMLASAVLRIVGAGGERVF